MTRRQQTGGRRYGAVGKIRRVVLATITFVTLLASGTWAIAADSDYLEPGWDRPGNDFRPPIDLEFKQNSFLTFEMECQALCEKDPRCKAWTMVKPGVQGALAKCYLKDPAPAQRKNSCCTSGVAARARPQLDPQEVADRDPTGKSFAQCEAAYGNNVSRCSARGALNMPACLAEFGQIRSICMNEAARALATGGGGGVPQEWADMLNAHNAKRKLHCVPPLTWSAGLAAEAQAWANQCTGKHSAAGGENLAFFIPSASNGEAFQNSWYCEVAHYDFNAPQVVGGFKNGCDPPVNGHFTQVIWKDSRQLGCGKQTCTINGSTGVNWVCRYSPPGNFNADNIGNLRQQVLAPNCAP